MHVMRIDYWHPNTAIWREASLEKMFVIENCNLSMFDFRLTFDFTIMVILLLTLLLSDFIHGIE